MRYHLQWLASDRDDDGQPKPPLVMRVERRVASQRNTSNVFVLAVPWQEPNAVAAISRSSNMSRELRSRPP
jgi:hypothetical protein